MRIFKNALVPMSMLVILVVLPLAESALAEGPIPQATPVIEQDLPPPDTTDTENLDEESTPTGSDLPPPAEQEIATPGAQSRMIGAQNTGCNGSNSESCVESLTMTLDGDGFQHLNIGDTVTGTYSLSLKEGHPWGMNWARVYAPENTFQWRETMHFENVESVTLSSQFTVTIRPLHVDSCINGQMALELEADLSRGTHGNYFTGILVERTLTTPCSFENPNSPVYPDIDNIRQNAICGDNNDEITFKQTGVTYTLGEWEDNEITIFFDADDRYYLPDDAVTSHTVTDITSDDLCLVSPNLRLVRQAKLCGPNNDVISIDQEGIAFRFDGWSDGQGTIHFTPEEDYTFAEDAVTSHDLIDDSHPMDCVTDFEVQIHETGFQDVVMGDIVPVTVTFSVADGHPFTFAYLDTYHTSGEWYTTEPTQLELGIGQTYTFTYLREVDDQILLACEDRQSITFHSQLEVQNWYDTPWDPALGRSFDFDAVSTVGCSFHDPDLEVYPDIWRIIQAEVCGANNDEISFHQHGVEYTLDGWNNNKNTIRFTAADGYELYDGATTRYDLTDAGDCITALPNIPELLNAVCGDDNDVYSNPDQPEHVTMTESGWIGNERSFTFTTAEGYALPSGFNPVVTVTDKGDCITDHPNIPQVLTEVCGDNNDVYSTPDQPANVTMEDSGWQNNERTFTFTPADSYMLPSGAVTAHMVGDAGLPCPTDAPVKPVQTQVCGPDNDEITIPPQPEGVALENDSGWENGTRTITFAIDPAFITDGESEFTFTDEDIACPIPTITLTVQLTPSDGESLEGAAWRLYAPVAAQNIGTDPYAEGTVGADNSIVVEGLIAGDYGLVVNADGYEQLDTVLTLPEGEASFAVQLQIAALQPVETPTPEPTIEPTAEPTIEPTVETTPATQPATAEPAPTESSAETSDVTGLPSTGSGPGGGFGILALAGLLAAMVLGIIGNRRRIQA